MDKSLEDIIKSKPRGGRRNSRRGTARAAVLGKPAVNPAVKARAAATSGAAQNQPQSATKIMVSNLPPDVTEQQIRELFSQTVGRLSNVTLTYDAGGRSKGIASVTFAKSGDGTKAYQQYNNRLIDGSRAMKIEIIVDPTKPATLAQRVAPAAAAATNGAPVRGSGRGRRGRGGRGRRGGGTDRPAKSAADLDAEMEDYTSTTAPAAAAAPAATA